MKPRCHQQCGMLTVPTPHISIGHMARSVISGRAVSFHACWIPTTFETQCGMSNSIPFVPVLFNVQKTMHGPAQQLIVVCVAICL